MSANASPAASVLTFPPTVLGENENLQTSDEGGQWRPLQPRGWARGQLSTERGAAPVGANLELRGRGRVPGLNAAGAGAEGERGGR